MFSLLIFSFVSLSLLIPFLNNFQSFFYSRNVSKIFKSKYSLSYSHQQFVKPCKYVADFNIKILMTENINDRKHGQMKIIILFKNE